MITLVYADHKDQDFKDKFHYAVCNIFEEIRRNSNGEVETLIDPNVTGDLLLDLMAKSEFFFYWGHGEVYQAINPVIFGSKIEDKINILDAGKTLKDSILYIDGCSLGAKLKSANFPLSLIITPFHDVSYKTSVLTGCRCVLELVGKKKDFKSTFDMIASTSNSLSYKLLGNGENKNVNISEESRLAIVSGFFDILLKWNELKE